jgi:hypothetical protein
MLSGSNPTAPNIQHTGHCRMSVAPEIVRRKVLLFDKLVVAVFLDGGLEEWGTWPTPLLWVPTFLPSGHRGGWGVWAAAVFRVSLCSIFGLCPWVQELSIRAMLGFCQNKKMTQFVRCASTVRHILAMLAPSLIGRGSSWPEPINQDLLVQYHPFGVNYQPPNPFFQVCPFSYMCAF